MQLVANDSHRPEDRTAGWKRIARRTMQVGFFFFLIKGIAWLVVGWLAWQGLS